MYVVLYIRKINLAKMHWQSDNRFVSFTAQENEMGIGICGWLLTAFSWAIVIVTLPFSLCVCFKVQTTNQIFDNRVKSDASKIIISTGCPRIRTSCHISTGPAIRRRVKRTRYVMSSLA